MDDDHGLDDELVDRCGQQMMSSHVDSRDKQLAIIGQTWGGGGRRPTHRDLFISPYLVFSI